MMYNLKVFIRGAALPHVTLRASVNRARLARLPGRLPESELARAVGVTLQDDVRCLLQRGHPDTATDEVVHPRRGLRTRHPPTVLYM